ncbi:shikimate kinase [Halosquirtibacter laminarini]|uniref:Shikimate kinase n=1 Tax=Halosquirtibacter laminarini TaxID=3374600 RepID=A0AC61NN34_9BACT|nr:shikimate kinase [Prolixibacteraceae bacterium]
MVLGDKKINRVYLNGYMGSGKSTIGLKLAQALNFAFVDMDKFIEEKYFMSISAIFAKEGESGFREKERMALVELSQFDHVVIATGGGTPCFFNNIDVISETGVSVYLDTPIPILVQRLSQNNSQRPIVKGKSREELFHFIEGSLSERVPYYMRSTVVIHSDDTLTATTIIDHIEAVLS